LDPRRSGRDLPGGPGALRLAAGPARAVPAAESQGGAGSPRRSRSVPTRFRLAPGGEDWRAGCRPALLGRATRPDRRLPLFGRPGRGADVAGMETTRRRPRLVLLRRGLDSVRPARLPGMAGAELAPAALAAGARQAVRS